MLTKLQETIHPSAPLGQKSPYPTSYDRALLYPIERALQRQAMNFSPDLVFHGYDVWHADELLWLDQKGKPVRAYACLVVPASSKYLFESKSVKLYLHSLNKERFSSMDEVNRVISRDLSELVGVKVQVFLSHESFAHLNAVSYENYHCIDGVDIEISRYHRAPELLHVDSHHVVEEKLASHVFKSHCLCTGQPDMGSIFVDYHGHKIHHDSLLAYLVSYSEHAGFAENCIEQIFADLMEITRPHRLHVHGQFTTRGGIRINPYRLSYDRSFDSASLFKQ